jgi:hypothetical protein
MTFKFGLRSKSNLSFVHPDLIALAYKALELSTVDFVVTEGKRTKARQRELFKSGLSKTLNSRHLQGFAIDVAALYGGKVTWNWQPYEDIAKAFKEASKELGIPVEWGGDWNTFKDGPHFQLPHSDYPDVKDATAGEQA